jgi:large subunit ribosomal protein L3
MVKGLWGKKVGMTQIYSKDKVVPVTVVDVSDWLVTCVKTHDRDGYDAVCVGRVRNKYKGQSFSKEWVKKSKKYFTLSREIKISGELVEREPGLDVDFYNQLKEGDVVDVIGRSTGKGFAGVMKRHGFSGGPGSHGGKIGRGPGAIGFMTACGRVIKGKKLPGRMGNRQRTIKGLSIMKVDQENKVVLVKGAIPGSAGTFVFIRRRD